MSSHRSRIEKADIASLVIDHRRRQDSGLESREGMDLPQQRFDELAHYLNNIIADFDAIDEHVRYLQTALLRNWPSAKLDAAARRRFLDAGAASLNPDMLVGALLDPAELLLLHQLVDEEFPDFFAEALLDAANRDYADSGEPPLQSPTVVFPIGKGNQAQTTVLTRSPWPAAEPNGPIWHLSADDCQWKIGHPGLVGPDAPHATIKAEEWTFEDTVGITLRISGFLAPGHCARVEICILAEESVELNSRSLASFNLPFSSQELVGVPIRLRHRRHGERAWDLTVYLSF